MLIPAAIILSEARKPSFHRRGRPGKAPPLTVLIGLFTSWCRCCFGCLVTQWWRLPVPRGEMNEWAEIFTLGAVATARAAHGWFHNSTCSYSADTAVSWGIWRWQKSLCTVLSAHKDMTLSQKSQAQNCVLVSLIKDLPLLSSMEKTTDSCVPPALNCTSSFWITGQLVYTGIYPHDHSEDQAELRFSR